MKKENLNKIKRLYQEWGDSTNVRTWTCQKSVLPVMGREIEEFEAVATMSASFAGYVAEMLRQVIESEEELKDA